MGCYCLGRLRLSWPVGILVCLLLVFLVVESLLQGRQWGVYWPSKDSSPSGLDLTVVAADRWVCSHSSCIGAVARGNMDAFDIEFTYFCGAWGS
jgi:hypothetical protein